MSLSQTQPAISPSLPLDLLERRDLSRFLQLRPARPSDDEIVGELLVRTFLDSDAEKMPQFRHGENRIRELRATAERRCSGITMVAELGFEIIGTFSLIHWDFAAVTQAWQPQMASLRCVAIDRRFHGLKLTPMFLDRARSLAHTWRANSIGLHVQQGAHGVARTYTKWGFQRDPSGDSMSNGIPLDAYIYGF